MLYRIRLASAAQRRIDVELRLGVEDLADVRGAAGLPRGSRPDAGTSAAVDEVELFMPAWTPGSYLIREFARQVHGVRVHRVDGTEIPVRKRTKNRWSFSADDAGVVVSWQVYAHELTVRTACVTEDFAFWNGANVVLWPAGIEQSPARFEVDVPNGWSFVAGSAPVELGEGTATFSCANLDEAVDTPCLCGPVEAFSFEFGDREHRFVHAGLAGVRPPERFRDDVAQIVRTTAAVFGGELPYPRYTFLSLHSAAGRGGLEHCDSTTLLAPRTTFRPRAAYEDFLALIAHEYLHVWNVKRMRPREFWDYDYESENYTRLLWVAEGMTAYLDDLLVRRAGISSPAAYLERLESHVRGLLSNPGRHVLSLADSSFDAWIRLYRPDENTRNSSQNYYTNGALAAFVIDVAIRRSSGGARSLDDALRALWRRSFDEGRGYDLEDVLACIDTAAGRSLSRFVLALVEGPFDPNLGEALELFGLELEGRGAPVPFLGVRFRSDTTILASVEDGTPAHAAGLCPGDELLAVDGLRVESDSWNTVWDQVAAADRPVSILLARRGVIRTCSVTPVEEHAQGMRIKSVASPTESQLAHRESWLGDRRI
ncbi:MAG: PDZ domain-containing protein [Planctomycetota bacterium]|nr:PDZ domain-containing protein [Planctomycetota bacterium]MDA0932744.1 PDZ domain-containing protein [Planctomycetota bacterium]MDA1221568.1 PDZ domain-containing protein [Planctomycetota bacterium]